MLDIGKECPKSEPRQAQSPTFWHLINRCADRRVPKIAHHVLDALALASEVDTSEVIELLNENFPIRRADFRRKAIGLFLRA